MTAPYLVLEVPKAPPRCSNCNRKLDGRMVSPHWPWDTPCLTPGFPDWVCSYCQAAVEEDDPLGRDLPANSRQALERYLDSPTS